MLRLDGKVAIVTGAGSVGEGWGNGKATAVLLARQGAKVLALDNRAEAAQETVRIIEREGGKAFAYVCNVTSSSEFTAAVADCIARYGRLDILVNNVGGSEPGGAESMPEDVWERQIDFNLRSAFLGCKVCLPHLKAQPGSAIVNLSSVAALRMLKGRTHVAYSAAKYGVIALSRSVAIENARAGVRCNTVVPGLMNTPVVAQRLVRQLGSTSADQLAAERDAKIPLGKAGDAWDIAHAVLFLVSDEARHITGTELVVDGGYTAVAA